MATGTPVVVSRIQNRRGTQSQFDNLYPGEYISAPGATSAMSVVTVASTNGLVVGRPVFVNAGVGKFAPGTVVMAITSGTEFVVSITPSIPLSGTDTIVASPKYNGSGGAIGPDILQPGEIALCTDSRRVFIGNLNGEYVELTDTVVMTDIITAPLIVQLPPSPALFTVIPALTHMPTPFLSFIYSAVDVITHNSDTVGITFARNGQMTITAILQPLTTPPLPVTLSDSSTEINSAALVSDVNPPYGAIQPDLSFRADYNVDGNIEISYTHNFTTTLTLSTSSIIWAPF